MYLCSDKHDEMCHEGRSCPACSEIEKKDDMIESLKDEIVELKEEIKRFEEDEA